MCNSLLALIALLTLFPVLALAEPPSVTLTANLEGSICPEGQAVVLSLALHNVGADRLIIGGSAFEESSFQISVTDGAGKVVPRTAVGERILTPPMSVSANSTVALPPGQTLSYRFNLARLFDLSRAGTYTVNVSRRLRPKIWPPEINLLAPLPVKTPPVMPPPAVETPPQEFTLVADHLTVHMVEDAVSKSGPTAYVAPPSHQTFLYMASQYSPGVSRCQVSGDGSVSFALEPDAPGPGTPLPTPSLGAGPDGLVATPDGRFLYANNGSDHTVAQFRVGDNGVLFPLSPPTVPAHPFPGPLLMDPQGRFLYSLSGTVYAIGLDGRLTVTASAENNPPSKNNALKNNTVVQAYFGVLNSTGTCLYTGGGMSRLASNGEVSALPSPASGPLGQNGGNDNAIALSPSGKFAFIGVSTTLSNAFFDKLVPMRVAQDGTLTPLPGSAQTPQTPTYPTNFNPPTCSTLAVDPTGRFLIALCSNFLDCYRIGLDGSLAFLSMTTEQGDLDSIFFLPGSPLAYVHNRNSTQTPSLLAFRFDDRQGLIPAGVDLPNGTPFDATVAATVAPTPLEWGPVSGGVSVSIRLPADVLPANAPMVVTVTLKNVTRQPVRLGRAGADMSSFRLTIVGPQRQSPGVLRGDGEPLVAAVPFLSAGHDLLDTPGPSAVPVILPPGGQRQYRFVLSRLADLTVAGHYTVQITRNLSKGIVVASPVVPFLLEGPFDGRIWDSQYSVQVL